MLERRDLLVEIGTEELPARGLKAMGEALAEGLWRRLAEADLGPGRATAFATPRRLAALIEGVALMQPPREKVRRGPALTAAFDEDGLPTKAALGFARACGVKVEDLETLETEKGAWLVCRLREKGKLARVLLPEMVSQTLAGLPLKKRMRWGRIREGFARPVHWLLVMLGEETVPMERFGIRAGGVTYGHRFHHPGPIRLPSPRDYPHRLREGKVLAAFGERLEVVRRQVEREARRMEGRALMDEALLEEVAGLVEWPVAIAGRFDERFLRLPPEVIQATLKGHQKAFPLVDGEGALLPRFVMVSNIESRRPQAVREGYERVIRPRLADAAFFWDRDRTKPLIERLEDLKKVVFQEGLGSLYDKAMRLEPLAGAIMEAIGGERLLAERAALLCKCDLLTEMVGEFPELQGIMGRYYALHDGEPEAVAQAIEEHYLPRFAGDRLPETPAGCALAVADKCDTLVGLFSLGLVPSGDKDPFGLRRQALGVLRVLIERGLSLDLMSLLERAAEGIGGATLGAVPRVFDFMMERLKAYFLEQGGQPDVFQAVAAARPTRPLDFYRRLEAVAAFKGLPEAESLTAAHKRIRNILRQARERGERIPAEVDPALFREPAEQVLHQRVEGLKGALAPLMGEGRYTEALALLASLKGDVDAFFDEVLVMADDVDVRHNRLALLAALKGLFDQVADIAELHG